LLVLFVYLVNFCVIFSDVVLLQDLRMRPAQLFLLVKTRRFDSVLIE